MSRCEVCGAKDHGTVEHHTHLVASLPRFTVPRPDMNVEALLAFEYDHPQSPLLVAKPQKPFQPRGLMLWDVGLLNVQAALIGTNHELLCSFGLVPARWFAVQQSFDAVMRAQNAGDAAAWGHWSVCHPGMLVRLVFDGPADRVKALMWGHSS